MKLTKEQALKVLKNKKIFTDGLVTMTAFSADVVSRLFLTDEENCKETYAVTIDDVIEALNENIKTKLTKEEALKILKYDTYKNEYFTRELINIAAYDAGLISSPVIRNPENGKRLFHVTRDDIIEALKQEIKK